MAPGGGPTVLDTMVGCGDPEGPSPATVGCAPSCAEPHAARASRLQRRVGARPTRWAHSAAKYRRSRCRHPVAQARIAPQRAADAPALPRALQPVAEQHDRMVAVPLARHPLQAVHVGELPVQRLGPPCRVLVAARGAGDQFLLGHVQAMQPFAREVHELQVAARHELAVASLCEVVEVDKLVRSIGPWRCRSGRTASACAASLSRPARG